MLSSSKRGQVTFEYLLLIFMVVFTILGIFFPIVKDKFESIQDELKANTQSVIAQDQLGIPISWFDLQAEDDLDIRLNALNSGLSGGPNGNRGGNGPSSSPTGDTGEGVDPTGGTKKPGDSIDINSGSLNNSVGGSSSGGSGSGSSSSTSSAQANSESGNEGLGNSGGSSVVVRNQNNSESSLDGSSSGDSTAPESGPAGEIVAGAEEEEEGGGGLEAKRKAEIYDGREETRRGAGCEDIDFATLLKMIAIIGIVLVGAIMAFTSRGGGKNAK